MNPTIARVFDFDDTLATSSGFIRILHHVRGAPADTRGWLESFGISGREGPMGSVELSTGQYAKYAHEIHELTNEGLLHVQTPGHEIKKIDTDVIDYSGVAKLIDPKPIAKTIEIARESFARGEIMGVITGRSGSPTMLDITGASVKINNKREIARFLMKHGIPMQLEDIHCIGDLPGGVPLNKANTMKWGFIEKYDPDRIIFYDDDHRNIQSVSQVDERISCIDAKNLHEGWGTTSSIVDFARKRRATNMLWSKAILNAGIER